MKKRDFLFGIERRVLVWHEPSLSSIALILPMISPWSVPLIAPSCLAMFHISIASFSWFPWSWVLRFSGVVPSKVALLSLKPVYQCFSGCINVFRVWTTHLKFLFVPSVSWVDLPCTLGVSFFNLWAKAILCWVLIRGVDRKIQPIIKSSFLTILVPSLLSFWMVSIICEVFRLSCGCSFSLLIGGYCRGPVVIVVGVRTEGGPSRFSSGFWLLPVLYLFFFFQRAYVPQNQSTELTFNGLNLLRRPHDTPSSAMAMLGAIATFLHHLYFVGLPFDVHINRVLNSRLPWSLMSTLALSILADVA